MIKAAITLILALATCTVRAEFIIDPPSSDPFIQQLTGLSKVIDTAGQITISVRECGHPNAFWNRQETIILCTELIQKINTSQQNTIRHGTTPKDASIIATGEMLFIVLHEIAHAIIQRHQIAITGREEDAADQFAAWMLILSSDPMFYVGASNFFAAPKNMFGEFPKERTPLTDEHSLDMQRRAQLVCWGLGKHPQIFSQVANYIKMTRNRAQRCQDEYEALMTNTPKVFAAAIKKRP